MLLLATMRPKGPCWDPIAVRRSILEWTASISIASTFATVVSSASLVSSWWWWCPCVVLFKNTWAINAALEPSSFASPPATSFVVPMRISWAYMLPSFRRVPRRDVEGLSATVSVRSPAAPLLLLFAGAVPSNVAPDASLSDAMVASCPHHNLAKTLGIVQWRRCGLARCASSFSPSSSPLAHQAPEGASSRRAAPYSTCSILCRSPSVCCITMASVQPHEAKLASSAIAKTTRMEAVS
mmetsp:Transcript_18486/g.56495  ORF Transcript_18486/g.56495 Transcript_18486/m.56495 type:complete len:239 (-) Transcript_18486:675-1391(-)